MKTMAKIGIALTASQHFDKVYPYLTDIVDVIEMRSLDAAPVVEGAERVFHSNGFINDEFGKLLTTSFLKKLEDSGIRSLSFDLGPSCEIVRMEDFYKPGSSVLSPDSIIDIGRRRIDHIRSIYTGAISMENLDYHEGGAYEHVCEPSFISRAIRELDTGLTLDIGHANVTAFNKNMAVRDYISMLPLDRLTEVHFSHATKDDDAHDAPTHEDYEVLEFIFSKATPNYVVLEYFRKPDIIIEQMRALHKFIGSQRKT